MSAKVLIVEDEFLIGLELEHALEAHGYRVVGVVADYPGAIALAAQRPDVALIDINLRDGPTGPLIARELARIAGASIVFVTANPRQVEGPVAGALGVVTKPAESALVAAVVDYAVAVREGGSGNLPEGLIPLELARRANGGGSESPAE
ncbi:MAG: response regulator [Allosphingosinicella sp.]|uniref:response regulator n=1 Tax=Allosphingosinicella sp. TaxID=2823234 RepID=UPI0039227786